MQQLQFFDIYGRMLYCDRLSQGTACIPCADSGIKIVRVCAQGKASAKKVFVE